MILEDSSRGRQVEVAVTNIEYGVSRALAVMTSDGMALSRRYATEVVSNGPVFKSNNSNDAPCIVIVP